MKGFEVTPDYNYLLAYHSPGIEPWITSFLQNLSSSNGLLLDVGCGLGFWGYLIKAYIHTESQVVGIDISSDKLDRLHSFHLYDNLICADARYLPFRVDSFNLVLAIEVLQGLLPDLKRILESIDKLVKRGGLIVVTMPKRNECVKDLLLLGYEVLANYLRGLFVVRLKDMKVIPTYRTLKDKLASMILSLICRLFKFRIVNYVIALKAK